MSFLQMKSKKTIHLSRNIQSFSNFKLDWRLSYADFSFRTNFENFKYFSILYSLMNSFYASHASFVEIGNSLQLEFNLSSSVKVNFENSINYLLIAVHIFVTTCLLSDIIHIPSICQLVLSMYHLVSSVSQLVSPICHLVSSICHLASFVSQLVSSICHQNVIHILSNVAHISSDIFCMPLNCCSYAIFNIA